MDRRNTAIILVILTSLLCGLPGLAGLCIGPLAVLGSQLPDSNLSQGDSRIALVAGILLICFGLILIAIPIVTGFLTLRRKNKKLVNIEGMIPPEDF